MHQSHPAPCKGGCNIPYLSMRSAQPGVGVNQPYTAPTFEPSTEWEIAPHRPTVAHRTRIPRSQPLQLQLYIIYTSCIIISIHHYIYIGAALTISASPQRARGLRGSPLNCRLTCTLHYSEMEWKTGATEPVGIIIGDPVRVGASSHHTCRVSYRGGCTGISHPQSDSPPPPLKDYETPDS